MKVRNMVKGLISMVLTISLMPLGLPVKVQAESKAFPDIQSHWGKNSIEYATGKGIISGYPNGNYGPEDTITVEQFIILLVRTLGKQDVPLGLDNYIAAAQELGILQVGEHYDYKSPILRGDMAKMAIRAYEALNTNVEYPELLDAFKGLVSDYDSISDTLKTSVLKCVEQGIIAGGDGGNFNEKSTSTRAQAASVIHRLLSAEERARVKPVFAEPDYEFEAFMKTPEAAEFFSTLRVEKIENGLIYWASRWGEDGLSYGDYGVSILPTFYNKDSNKEAYNAVKTLVGYARQSGKQYVLSGYHDNGDWRWVEIKYYWSKGAGQGDTSDYGNFRVYLSMEPYKSYDLTFSVTKQKEPTYYEWGIFSFFDNEEAMNPDIDLIEIRGRTDKYVLPLKALIQTIYSKELGLRVFDYVMEEHSKSFEIGWGIRKPKEDEEYRVMYDGSFDYVNTTIGYDANLNNMEIQNMKNYGPIVFGTNKVH